MSVNERARLESESKCGGMKKKNRAKRSEDDREARGI